MPGTPSMLLGTSTPCQWIVVGTGSEFLSVTRTVSPSVTWISGPGIWPLKVQALTVLPGSSSQSTALASKVYSLVTAGAAALAAPGHAPASGPTCQRASDVSATS